MQQMRMQIEQEHVQQATKGFIYIQGQSKAASIMQRNPAMNDAAYDEKNAKV
jgi:hypothetical protein